MFPKMDEDIETIITNVLGRDVEIVDCNLEPFTKDKTGGLGTHYCLKVKIKQRSKNECDNLKTVSFFVKTQPESTIIQNYLMDEYTFLEEIKFYSEIKPIMHKVCKTKKWSPECYLAKRDVLVMEDLRAQGYKIFNTNILNEQYLKSALSTLAQFHASSIILEKHLGKTLKTAYPNAFEEKVFTDHNKFGRSVKMGFENAAMIIERFKLDVSLVPKIYDRVIKLIRIKKDKFNVICHGDLWVNNLMFDNSSPPKCLLIDFQFLRYASPTVDVNMLIYVHTTLNYRKKCEYELFEHYYFCLRDTLLLNNCEIDIPSYDDLLKDYKERRLVGMVFAIFYLPGLYMKADDLNKIMSDPMILKNWLLRDRIEFTRRNMDEDPMYEKKMKDIATELMDEAHRIFDHSKD